MRWERHSAGVCALFLSLSLSLSLSLARSLSLSLAPRDRNNTNADDNHAAVRCAVRGLGPTGPPAGSGDETPPAPVGQGIVAPAGRRAGGPEREWGEA